MSAYDARKAIQQILGTKADGMIRPGGETETMFKRLIALPNVSPWPPAPTPHGDILRGDGSWPFTVRVDGDDLVCENIVITCFGGAHDPQDDGDTASGLNTKTNPVLEGVSIPMDGRRFSRLTSAEHRALDGAPFPRIPWFTKVVISIGNRTFTPARGIIDLGPGKQATKRVEEPHALDVTEELAAQISPTLPRRFLSSDFETRGSFRVIGGARFILT